ncbi:hypothetical protein PRK78_005338 [Emydomyces testavorans]|uniref:Uncharacterized protein n=1 Tax=Emydomyces testavorans TaxID=2070801 RepID=A0AAF0DLJ3_9EURO|nr:hypothetical protein PRK78_005338 [Emydomyces testavorans]
MAELESKSNGRRRTQVAVNSSLVHARGPYSTLPCPVLSPDSPTSAGGLHQGNYEPHVYSRSTPVSLQSAPANCSPYPLLQSGLDCGTGNGSNVVHRSSYISSYPLSYGDEASYHVQHVQPGVLPNGEVTDGNAFGGSAGTKPWYESCQTKSMQAIYPDSDGNNAMATSGYPFMLQQSHTPVPTDNVSAFPVINSLSNGLTSSDRTLPNPVAYRNSTLPPAASILESSMNVSTIPSHMSNDKSTWAFDKHLSNDFHILRANSSAIGSSERLKPLPSSPADISFGYIPISSNSSGPPVSTPPCTLPDPMGLPDRYQTANKLGRSKVPERESFPETYTSEVYGYDRSRSSRGSLISGHLYVRNPSDSEPITIHRPDPIMRSAPLTPLNNAEGI